MGTKSLDLIHKYTNPQLIFDFAQVAAKTPQNGLDLSKTPMLSSPRKPPENIFFPLISFLFIHLKLKICTF
jgi:hypothetical protein